MAWSETYIRDRARELCRTYADEERVQLDDVRVAFQEFATQYRVFLLTETPTPAQTIRLQRIYEVTQVLDGSAVIPHGYSGETWRQSAPYEITFNGTGIPSSLTVQGYGVPDNINAVELQPELLWQDALAHLVAANVLMRYGDAQAVERSRMYRALADQRLTQLYRQHAQPITAAQGWDSAYIVMRAREYVGDKRLAPLITDSDALHATQEFALETRAHRRVLTYTTVANQRRYPLQSLVADTVLYDGAPIPLLGKDAYGMQGYYTERDELVLTFEPAPGKPLRIEGSGAPQAVSDMTLEPARHYMDAIAARLAADRLMVYGDKSELPRAQYLMAQYQSAVQRARAQVYPRPLRRGRARYLSHDLPLT